MTSAKKKLYTVVVEDSNNSPTELLQTAANESAVEYASIYNWKNISLEASSYPPKIVGTKAFYFYDIYGDGEAQSFDVTEHISESQTHNHTGFAAKEANP